MLNKGGCSNNRSNFYTKISKNFKGKKYYISGRGNTLPVSPVISIVTEILAEVLQNRIVD